MLNSLKNLFKKKQNNEPELLREVPAFPGYICLEITNACNLRCKQCMYKGGTTAHYATSVGFIDLGFAKNILLQLSQYNCGVMLNGDGEALLHRGFHKIALYAMSLNLPNVYFNTNGTLFTPDFTDTFIEYFKGSVSFSLDGFKESHERIRVGSKYDTVISHIEYLQQKIQNSGADIKVAVSFCNYDQPEGEREEFVKHWVDKVDIVSVGEVYDKDYKIISEQINRQKEKKRIMCGIPWETLIVRWDGLVVPCSNCFSLDSNNNAVLGDAKCEPLDLIWQGEEATQLRQRTENWQLAGTICEECDRWNMYAMFGESEEGGVLISRTGVFTTYKKLI